MRSWKWIMAAAIITIVGRTAQATVTVGWEAGTVQTTTALASGPSANGNLMGGMTVVATFEDGSKDTATWISLGSDQGQAYGENYDWSVWEKGLTDLSFVNGYWLLDYTGNGPLDSNLEYYLGITNLSFDAGAGSVVFDTEFVDPGTAFSSNGLSFGVASVPPPAGDINAVYSGLVGIDGNPPVGDLFRYLDISFTSPFHGLMWFYADTNRLQISGDIHPVPEPSTLLLLGSGVLGLFGYGRSRTRS